MPNFHYQAVDQSQKTVKGAVEAATPLAARKLLRKQNLLPIEVHEARKSLILSLRDMNGANGKMPAKMLALFTRQLATLLGSGVRVEAALETIATQSANPKLKATALDLRANVLDGQSLGVAVEGHPQTFDRFYASCLIAGEVSGRLPLIASKLADHVDNAAKNRQAVILAMIYPALLALISVAVVIALLTFVVPDIVRAFTARGADLPALTRGLIATSDWLNRFGLRLILGLGLIAAGLARAFAYVPFRHGWHRFLVTFRPTRGAVLKLAGVQFTGTLATLLNSNVTLADALGVASQTLHNSYLRARLQDLVKQVREGASLSTAMTDLNIFQPMTIAMVVSGEASGDLGSGLERSSEDQLTEVNALIKTIVSLVEPLVLLVMGGVVMLLVLAILLPIINLNGVVQ